MSSSSASGPASGSFSGPTSRSRRLASRQVAKARSQTRSQARFQSGTHPTRRSKRGAIATAPSSKVSPMAAASKLAKKPAAKKPAVKKSAVKQPLRAPRPVRQWVRWLVRGPQKASRKVLMAGGSVATLAALVIVPTRVDSQQVALSSCQEVVQSGAEISRAQVTSLLAVPEGSRREAVRQVIDVPYCLLPTQKEEARASEIASEIASEAASEIASKAASEAASEKVSETAAEIATIVTEREAYPLAFDPDAWVVVRYAEGEYAGYDFVFKP